MKLLRMIACAAAFVGLSGCVSLLPDTSPPAPRYSLAAAQAPQEAGAPVAWRLIVEDPTAPRALDTTDIALTRAPLRYEYYAHGEWVDRAGRLLGSAITRTFENDPRILAVSDRSTQAGGDFALSVDMRNFEAVYANGAGVPSVKIAFYAKLVRLRGGRIVAARLFEVDAPAADDSLSAVAAAFAQASRKVLGEAREWTLSEGEKAWAVRPAPEAAGRGAQGAK